MSKPIEANALYDQLCKAYKPLYYPTEEEKKEAIMILSVALYSRVKPEEMIQKAGVLSILHGNHKSKVTTLIIIAVNLSTRNPISKRIPSLTIQV